MKVLRHIKNCTKIGSKFSRIRERILIKNILKFKHSVDFRKNGRLKKNNLHHRYNTRKQPFDRKKKIKNRLVRVFRFGSDLCRRGSKLLGKRVMLNKKKNKKFFFYMAVIRPNAHRRLSLLYSKYKQTCKSLSAAKDKYALLSKKNKKLATVLTKKLKRKVKILRKNQFTLKTDVKKRQPLFYKIIRFTTTGPRFADKLKNINRYDILNSTLKVTIAPTYKEVFRYLEKRATARLLRNVNKKLVKQYKSNPNSTVINTVSPYNLNTLSKCKLLTNVIIRRKKSLSGKRIHSIKTTCSKLYSCYISNNIAARGEVNKKSLVKKRYYFGAFFKPFLLKYKTKQPSIHLLRLPKNKDMLAKTAIGSQISRLIRNPSLYRSLYLEKFLPKHKKRVQTAVVAKTDNLSNLLKKEVLGRKQLREQGGYAKVRDQLLTLVENENQYKDRVFAPKVKKVLNEEKVSSELISFDRKDTSKPPLKALNPDIVDFNNINVKQHVELEKNIQGLRPSVDRFSDSKVDNINTKINNVWHSKKDDSIMDKKQNKNWPPRVQKGGKKFDQGLATRCADSIRATLPPKSQWSGVAENPSNANKSFNNLYPQAYRSSNITNFQHTSKTKYNMDKRIETSNENKIFKEDGNNILFKTDIHKDTTSPNIVGSADVEKNNDKNDTLLYTHDTQKFLDKRKLKNKIHPFKNNVSKSLPARAVDGIPTQNYKKPLDNMQTQQNGVNVDKFKQATKVNVTRVNEQNMINTGNATSTANSSCNVKNYNHLSVIVHTAENQVTVPMEVDANVKTPDLLLANTKITSVTSNQKNFKITTSDYRKIESRPSKGLDNVSIKNKSHTNNDIKTSYITPHTFEEKFDQKGLPKASIQKPLNVPYNNRNNTQYNISNKTDTTLFKNSDMRYNQITKHGCKISSINMHVNQAIPLLDMKLTDTNTTTDSAHNRGRNYYNKGYSKTYNYKNAINTKNSNAVATHNAVDTKLNITVNSNVETVAFDQNYSNVSSITNMHPKLEAGFIKTSNTRETTSSISVNSNLHTHDKVKTFSITSQLPKERFELTNLSKMPTQKPLNTLNKGSSNIQSSSFVEMSTVVRDNDTNHGKIANSSRKTATKVNTKRTSIVQSVKLTDVNIAVDNTYKHKKQYTKDATKVHDKHNTKNLETNIPCGDLKLNK